MKRTTTNSWFEVSKSGLGKVIADRDKVFIISELAQNAWDENSTHVEITLSAPVKGMVDLVVVDDNPAGFIDLAHAYRMFEESFKKNDASKRGRFNLGEKLFLCLCSKATICSTTGIILFNEDGTRSMDPDVHTAFGTRIEATLPMTDKEYKQVLKDVQLLLPPASIPTTFNGEPLKVRTPVKTFETILATVLGDEQGILRKTTRKTTVELYDVAPGEKPHIYEMGIPIVVLKGGDRWHINVMQKVPQNTDRDNVTPAYLNDLRTEVLNHTYDLLNTEEETSETWVGQALGDERITAEALTSIVETRFGKNVVAHDPRDAEATHTAMAAGYRPLYGGSLPKGAWANIKAKTPDLIQSASIINDGAFATAKPYGPGGPDSKEVKVIAESDYTDGMRDVVALTKELCKRFRGHGCQVIIVDAPQGNFGACYGHNSAIPNFSDFHYNLGTLWGRERWFDLKDNLKRIITIIAHEFAHDVASNHLDAKFYGAIEEFAGFIASLMQTNPGLFAPGALTAMVS